MTAPDDSFAGKVAIVTGGASGIGLATAKQLRDRGAQVVTVGRGPGNDLVCDVRDASGVDAVVAEVVDRFGTLDLAVNSAGISGGANPVSEMSGAAWDEMLAVNLTGVFHCLGAELRAMLPLGSGSIVNVASVAAFGAVPTMAHYSAAKAGVVALTKAASLEAAAQGVRVNAVCPGSVRTPMLLGWHRDEERMEAAGASWPMGRLAMPDEVAAAILWLLSTASSYVSGVVIPVDGGGAARR